MDIECRPATRDDLELLLAWRSHPSVYQHFYQQDGPLEWEGHVDWWESREERRDWIVTVREDETREWRDVGSVNVSDLDSKRPEVGIYVGEVTYWGQGVATAAVEFAVEWLASNGWTTARARIVDENEGSIQVFERVGFERVGDSRSGESEYEMDLTDLD